MELHVDVAGQLHPSFVRRLLSSALLGKFAARLFLLGLRIDLVLVALGLLVEFGQLVLYAGGLLAASRGFGFSIFLFCWQFFRRMNG